MNVAPHYDEQIKRWILVEGDTRASGHGARAPESLEYPDLAAANAAANEANYRRRMSDVEKRSALGQVEYGGDAVSLPRAL